MATSENISHFFVRTYHTGKYGMKEWNLSWWQTWYFLIMDSETTDKERDEPVLSTSPASKREMCQ